MAIEGKPLAGKVALVTGGSRGIGAAISRKLAAWGCDLYIGYVERAAPASALRDELRERGARVELVPADIASPDEIATIFDTIERGHGHLDILVANAGSTVFPTLAEATERHWQYVMDTNARSLLLLAQRARPLMAGRGGRILTLSNRSAVKYTARNALFGAAKAAIESLTRSLAKELAEDGIVVNCVRPGTVDTDVLRVRPDFREHLEHELAHSPWKRVTTVEDVGDAVALLCLDEAGWISGQTIVLDGGWQT